MPRKITRAKAKTRASELAAERQIAMRHIQAYFASRTRKQIREEQRRADRRLNTPEHLAAMAVYDRADKAMRRAWLKEHPGDPLPGHLCALDNPFPGNKRWCAAAKRWLYAYTKRTGHLV
jgi:hypothetical protein